MEQMSKKQETHRRLTLGPIFGFGMIVLSVWENTLGTLVFSLSNGGTAGLIWGYLFCMVGFGFVTLSLAELVSL